MHQLTLAPTNVRDEALPLLATREALIMTEPSGKHRGDTEGVIAGSAAPRSERRQSIQRAAILLLSLLAGCSARAPHTEIKVPQRQLNAYKVERLLGAWKREVTAYISREGLGNPGVLSRTRALHARDVLRPARITFDVLDVDAMVPGRDGWDVRGVLIGKQTSSTHSWYVFLVGMVARAGYRPSSIDDIRPVAFSAQSGKLTWQVGFANPEAVQRYRAAFGGSAPIVFPGDTDLFTMDVTGDQVSVVEARSAARWSLRLTAAELDAHASENVPQRQCPEHSEPVPGC